MLRLAAALPPTSFGLQFLGAVRQPLILVEILVAEKLAAEEAFSCHLLPADFDDQSDLG
jgi:hypothetical protein